MTEGRVHNIYLPEPAVIVKTSHETADTVSLNLRYRNGRQFAAEDYGPGKFLQVTAFGAGEAPISLAGVNAEEEELKITVRSAGRVTGALCQLSAGDEVGLRGPYGNGFPVQDMEGRDLLLMAGGVGLPPLSHLVETLGRRRERYGIIKLLYGARSPAELLYKPELSELCRVSGVELIQVVESPPKGWSGRTGLVTDPLEGLGLKPEPLLTCICGPETMMEAAAEKLAAMGHGEEGILCSLERQMRCGVGKCGHCCLGEKYVCTDGPVFSYREFKRLLKAEGKG